MTHQPGPIAVNPLLRRDTWHALRTLGPGFVAETRRLLATAETGAPGVRAAERRWARRAIDALNIDVSWVGLDTIDVEETYVVVALHEGFADAALLLSLGLDLRFAARSELRSWPLLGEYLRSSDHLVIDPERPVAAMRALLSWAHDAGTAAESLAVFAQGTILGIETALQPGAFQVAHRSGRRILPVVIAGTHRVWEHPFGPTLRFGCPAYVEVLEPVAVIDVGATLTTVQRALKTRALGQSVAPVRRFDPDRDGVWPDYTFSVDPAFPEVAARVAELRRASAVDATA